MVDIALPYGGDITWTARGRALTVKDSPGNPAALQQQVEVLVFTAPRLIDVDGVAAGRPDNLFYPDRGGGLREMVGVLATPARIDRMRARILLGLLGDGTVPGKPGLTTSPAPSVQSTSAGATEYVTVTCYTTGGDPITAQQATGG